ncbi:DeoR family transcriptional regulator [Enterococcus faecalis]|uniref:DeoR family transcriptional regulator n=1 Tax=Enterococcus faecalis TaxID=1351 RepID=UPI001F5AFCB6|nr:DeoR family transcriptional regulator [Enterococcus faecalis]
MIEEYIEKEIMRQVKLAEYLYECNKLSIADLAKHLDVSFNTIKRDIQRLTFQLENFISTIVITKTHVSIWFDSAYTRYDLIKEIYSYSKFLNVCLSYLEGEENYLNIVENEFVSVTKAFQLKKSVENYFIEIGLFDKNKEWINDECVFRLVMLTILSRRSLDEHLVDKEQFRRSRELVDQLFFELSNGFSVNKRERIFLTLGIYLTISRFKEHPIQSISGYNNLKESLAFKEIKNKLKIFFKDIDLGEDEIFFITSIYKNIPLNSDNYMTIQLNYQYERKYVIEITPNIQSLIFYFEEEFQNSLFNQIMFERPLITFCYSMWNNLQNFIVYRHHYLNSEQLKIKQRVEKVLVQWKKKVWPDTPFTFNSLAIESFVSQISASLIFKEKQKRVFFIVAESEESHILYREVLKHWLNLDYNTIDSVLYYSVEKLPPYIKKNPHIIICERSVLGVHEVGTPHLYPISRYSIREDLKLILSESLDLVK